MRQIQHLTQTDQQPDFQRTSSSHVSFLQEDLLRTLFLILFQALQAEAVVVASATALRKIEWTKQTINGNVRYRTSKVDDEEVGKDNLVSVNVRGEENGEEWAVDDLEAEENI